MTGTKQFLPTVHGFDEFYGNLYHLNAEGKQTITDTGPLTRKRMETVEEDLLERSLDFIDRAHEAEQPFLLWHNTTRMHVWTRLSERWILRTVVGGEDHHGVLGDAQVVQLLQQLAYDPVELGHAVGVHTETGLVLGLRVRGEELPGAPRRVQPAALPQREAGESPRHEFFYYGEHELFALRYNNWKVHSLVKDDWFAGAMLRPTVPRPVNLRNDPFEHMDEPAYPLYAGEKLWTVLPAAALVQQHAATFEDFPPRQPPPDFNPQQMLERVLHAAAAQ